MSKSRKSDAREPMDPQVSEATTTVGISRNPRDCYGILTLVTEVNALFPEVGHETSNRDPFNVALDVTFYNAEDFGALADLLMLLIEAESARIKEVIVDSAEEQVLVSFHGYALTKDSRAPFGLASAHDILVDTHTVHRSAVTGRFVNEQEAEANPDTTEVLDR